MIDHLSQKSVDNQINKNQNYNNVVINKNENEKSEGFDLNNLLEDDQKSSDIDENDLKMSKVIHV